MAAYFFDASALVKCYVREAGNEWVKEIIARRKNHNIYVSVLTPAEVIAALARRERDSSLASGSMLIALSRIRLAMENRLTFVEPTLELMDLAISMAAAHG